MANFRRPAPMCAPSANSARIEHIVDAAAARHCYPFWKVSDGELSDALDRATCDARSFERAARQRRKAKRFLARLAQRRADHAARQDAARAEFAARRERLA